MAYIVGGISGVILLAWVAWTIYVLFGIEQPRYAVLEKRDGFELRSYEPYVVAYVELAVDEENALRQGFPILAGYIFGGNVSNTSIAMTAPVTETGSEKIAMTSPVTEQETGAVRKVTFMMPSTYTLETLPVPTDSRVQFAEVPAGIYAASRFTWYASEERKEKKKEAILAALFNEDDLTVIGAPIYAGYNDPWSFPLLLRNEILVHVEQN